MAFNRTDRRPKEDVGHGTRMGFRFASIAAIVVFIGILTYFIFGPRTSEPSNPPAGGNTQLEKQVAPPKEAVSPNSPAGPTSPPPENTP